jgi:hypothetical protein
MAESKHPIIARGELYVEPITKKSGGGAKKIPHEYETAKQKIISDIDKIFQVIQEKRELFLEEKIVCIRMEPKFEAKSYVPTQLLTDESMSIVGGRKYTFIDDTRKEQVAKLYFIKTDDTGIEKLKETLSLGKKDSVDAWCDQVGSIHSMDLLLPEEKIMGFPNGWENGTVEIVLHPLQNELEKMLSLFYSASKIPAKNTRVKTYEDGLTFISAKCNRSEMDKLKYFNPLRAIHPLGHIGITPVRMLSGGIAPKLTQSTKKSIIKVGVFDGGADDSIPLLKGHVKAIDCVSTAPNTDCLSHGSAVCGVVLHGNFAGKGMPDVLPIPCLSVESYRVLPIKDQDDFELYEAIDAIEKTVSSRKDIKLYNLSFGPAGAIIDDSINRFTYVLDRLTYEVPENEVNPLFCVAVGNDGELSEPLNRIQSPSDLVNGLGIGSYTYNIDGTKKRAPYSCIGSGREGAKIKPDFLDFGGSIDKPFVLVGLQADSLAISAGTSFASPLSVNKIGKLMAQSENISPHIGRTLLIHNSSIDTNLSQEEQGYGYCIEEAADVLLCNDKKVTILYAGTLEPTQIVNLPIFSPKINVVQGIVNISWTITTIVAPYANDPDAYTNNCIEDVFFPHDMTFKFYKRDSTTREIISTKKLNLFKPKDVTEAKVLFEQGYYRSEFPASHPVKHSWNESYLRATGFKWDTVIKKSQRMRGSSLLNPALTLHAIDRNGFNAQQIQYYVAITIEAPKYAGSLYDTILQTYQNLTPIKIRNINRIMVDVTHNQ